MDACDLEKATDAERGIERGNGPLAVCGIGSEGHREEVDHRTCSSWASEGSLCRYGDAEVESRGDGVKMSRVDGAEVNHRDGGVAASRHDAGWEASRHGGGWEASRHGGGEVRRWLDAAEVIRADQERDDDLGVNRPSFEAEANHPSCEVGAHHPSSSPPATSSPAFSVPLALSSPPAAYKRPHKHPAQPHSAQTNRLYSSLLLIFSFSAHSSFRLASCLSFSNANSTCTRSLSSRSAKRFARSSSVSRWKALPS